MPLRRLRRHLPINGEDPAAADLDRAVGRDEIDPAAGEHDLVAALVDLAVVVVAERNHLVQVGLATLGPELEVVGVGPAQRPVAARPGAGLEASLEAAPL